MSGFIELELRRVGANSILYVGRRSTPDINQQQHRPLRRTEHPSDRQMRPLQAKCCRKFAHVPSVYTHTPHAGRLAGTGTMHAMSWKLREYLLTQMVSVAVLAAPTSQIKPIA